MYYVEGCNTSFNALQPPFLFSVWQLLLRNDFTSSNYCCVFCSGVSFIWKGIAHILPWPGSINKYYIHRRVLLHSNAFLILLHGFQSNSSLPCEGTFTHTCTKTFFEECNNHRNTTPTPIFPEMCYYSSGNIAKSDAIPYVSTLQNAEYCIHSGTFWNSNFIEILPASVEAFYAKAMLHFLEGMPHHV